MLFAMFFAVDFSLPAMMSPLFSCEDLGHTVADELQLFTCLPEHIPTNVAVPHSLSCPKFSSSIHTNQLAAGLKKKKKYHVYTTSARIVEVDFVM